MNYIIFLQYSKNVYTLYLWQFSLHYWALPDQLKDLNFIQRLFANLSTNCASLSEVFLSLWLKCSITNE